MPRFGKPSRPVESLIGFIKLCPTSSKLWGFCYTLRHDGIDYGDYIEQITFLLFLKMADERGVELPKGCGWPTLRDAGGTDLIDTYTDLLRRLGKERGILGDIFTEAQCRFNKPVNLKLFADQAGEVFKILCEDCDLHTVLRLPRGTFTPYSQGVKANVVFFTKGAPTETVWIYDARTNVPGITKKDRPLTPAQFAEFEKCYGSDPSGRRRTERRKPPGSVEHRWRPFEIGEVRKREFKLDGFKWLKEESAEDADELPDPEELAADAMAELKAVVADLEQVVKLLGAGPAHERRRNRRTTGGVGASDDSRSMQPQPAESQGRSTRRRLTRYLRAYAGG